jgi:pimeloyl-ACP methyl ester carboxylesterase
MRRDKTRRVGRPVALALMGAGIAAGGAALARAERTWERAGDATGGRPLSLPPAAETTVRTPDGAELAVAVAGAADGPTVVLAHGWTNERRVWGEVAGRLAAGHRVVLYDHRGHGRSTVGTAPLDLDTLADDLRLVLEHVDVRDAVVAGHSMGGMTAQAFAVRHPEVCRDRVSALVLVATACCGIGGGPVEPPPGVVGHPLVNTALARRRLGRLAMRSALGDDPAAAQLDALAAMVRATPPEVRAELLRAMRTMDLRVPLAAVDLPVVVLSGTRDRVTPPPLSRHMVEAIPGARLVVIPGAGHQLMWEAVDEVVTAIADAARSAPALSESAS